MRVAKMTESLELTRIAPIYTIMHTGFGQMCYRHNVFIYNAGIPESRPGVDAVAFDADAKGCRCTTKSLRNCFHEDYTRRTGGDINRTNALAVELHHLQV